MNEGNERVGTPLGKWERRTSIRTLDGLDGTPVHKPNRRRKAVAFGDNEEFPTSPPRRRSPRRNSTRLYRHDLKELERYYNSNHAQEAEEDVRKSNYFLFFKMTVLLFF